MQLQSLRQNLAALGTGGVTAAEPIFLSRDNFSDEDPAPIVLPRTCVPGPGILNGVDTGSKYSITGGIADPAGQSGTAGEDPRLMGVSRSRVVGRAMYIRAKQTTAQGTYTNNFGWFPGVGSNGGHAYMLSDAGFWFTWDNANVAWTVKTFSLNTWYKLVVVMRSPGAYFIIDDQLVALESTWTYGPLYPTYRNYSARKLAALDAFHVFDMVDPAWSAHNLANGYTAAPISGETLPISADGITHIKWTPAAGEVLEVMVRRASDNDCWILRGSQAGSTFKLIQKEGGVEVERASAAQTWTPGSAYWVYANCWGNRIQGITSASAANSNPVNKFNYASATFNNTVGGSKVSGFVLAADFATFNRALPAAALAELQTYEI